MAQVETRAAKLGKLAGDWPQYAGLIARAIADGTSYSDCQGEILTLIARDGGNPPLPPSIEVGECLSHSAGWRAAAVDWLTLNAVGRVVGATDSDREVRERKAMDIGSDCGGSAMGLARRCLRKPLSKSDDLIGRAFSAGASDFGDIVADAAQKILSEAFAAQAAPWKVLGRVRSAKDF